MHDKQASMVRGGYFGSWLQGAQALAPAAAAPTSAAQNRTWHLRRACVCAATHAHPAPCTQPEISVHTSIVCARVMPGVL